jgi:hypothetical protein
MTETRICSRFSTSHAATILLDGGRTAVPCTIRDFNGDGAGLCVPGDVILPDSFDLYVPTARITCRVSVRWRDDERIGVSFGPADHSDPRIRHAGRH